jgi:hypothetical protein
MSLPERREHETRLGRSEFGRSTVWITCPYCDVEVEAYVWSLAGSGKRCECGALHTSIGVTVAP